MTTPRAAAEAARIEAKCLELAADLGPSPVAEALWDGDTQGWFLEIYVTGAGPRRLAAMVSHTSVGGPGDRAFETETWVAERVLEALAARGFVTWFPSPLHPDDECPSYARRAEAKTCESCGKPTLAPQASDPRPAWLCHRCYAQRSAEERAARDHALLSDPPSGPIRRAISYAITGTRDGEAVRWGGFTSALDGSFDHLPLVRCLRAVAPDAVDFERDHELGPEAVAALRVFAAAEVERLIDQLAALATEDPDERGSVSWDDRPLEEMTRLAESLDLEDARLVVYSNAGFRLRESKLNADVVRRGGAVSRAALIAAWRGAFGDADAVDQTIDQLERLGFVTVDGDTITPTEKGRHGVSREDE